MSDQHAEVGHQVQACRAAAIRQEPLNMQADPGAPQAADFEGWPDAPLLLRPAPLDYQQVASASPAGVRINDGR